LCIASSVSAEMYVDATGDVFDGGLSNLDILGAEITNDLDNLYVRVTTNADVAATNWGKYLIFFDTGDGGAMSGPNGNDPFNNPWSRNVGSMVGIDAFVGSWIDGGGGAIAYTWNGGGFNDNGFVAPDLSDATSGVVRWTVSLSALGLAVGDTFNFDVATTGGFDNDPAIDLLSTTDVQPGWGNGSYSPMAYSYTVVPAPGVLAMIGLAGLASRRRRS
jgi:hypothetical protein